MLKLAYIFLCIVSAGMYLAAPASFSQAFCNAELVLFLLSVALFLRSTGEHRNFFSFHLFFFISFFFINFVYPVFLYADNREAFFMFNLPFDDNLINKGTALAQLGFSTYLLGCVGCGKPTPGQENPVTLVPETRMLTVVNTLSVLFAFALFADVVFFVIRSGGVEADSRLALFAKIFLVLACVYNTLMSGDRVKGRVRVFFRVNRWPLISALLIVYACLLIGDRGPILFVVFLFTGLFVTYVYPLKLKTLVMLIAGGMFCMYLITLIRVSDTNLRNSSVTTAVGNSLTSMNLSTLWNIGMDLIINNRNLYAGMEYANTHGISYGAAYLPTLFCPVPMLPSLVAQFCFGKYPMEMSSAVILTEDAGVTDMGLGTNLIGDLYMNLGAPGVILGMFVLGWFVQYHTLRRKRSVYSLIIYLITLYYAVYLPRSTFDAFVQILVFTLIIHFIISRTFKHKSVNRPCVS